MKKRLDALLSGFWTKKTRRFDGDGMHSIGVTGNATMSQSVVSDQVIEEVRQRWDQGEAPDVGVVLGERPELEDQKSLVLELAYEEYFRRAEETGEEIDVESFCQRFPLCRYSLQRRIEVHQAFRDDLNWFTPPKWPQENDEYLSFHLLEELGRGGASRVFLAEEKDLGNRRVVLKVSTYGYREAQILSRLEHPNIVPVNSVEEDHENGLVAICMPFMSRWTLLDLMDVAYREGKPPGRFLPVLEALRQQDPGRAMPHSDGRVDPFLKRASFVDGMIHLMVQLADALRHTHRHGILHLDLKPTNALITADGRPLLLDFNLAVDDPTPDEVLGGTLPYMSPEQIRASVLEQSVSSERVDCRSDVFSVGVMMCELLGGSHPFGPVSRGELPSAAAERVLERQRERPPTALARVSGIDPALTRVVRQCLQTEPGDRPQTADELHTKLDACLTVPRRVERWMRTHPRIVALVAMLLMAVALGCSIFAMTRDPYDVRMFKKAKEAVSQGRNEEALRCINRAIDAEPDIAQYYHLRALVRQRMRDYAEAIADYRVAHRLSDDPIYLACIGYCYARLFEPELMRTYYQRAVDGGCETAEVYAGLGYCLFVADDYEAAIKKLDQALELEPDLVEALHTRALCEVKLAGLENRPPRQWVAGDIETAIQKRPTACHLYNAAALIGIRDEKYETDEERAAAVFGLLEEGVSSGLDRTAVESYAWFLQHRNGPRFEALVARAADETDSDRVGCLIPDPNCGVFSDSPF